MFRIALVALTACTGNPSLTDDGTTSTDEAGGTDIAGPTTDSGEARIVTQPWCERSDNSLRVECTVTYDRPTLVTLILSAEGLPTRTFTSDTPVAEHVITGWGLRAATEYTWALAGDTGTVTTGSLPPGFLAADIQVTGTAFGFDAVLHPMSCAGQGYFTMIDGDGQIIWYEPNDVYFVGSMTGYEWSQEHRTVLSASGDRYAEQHVSGEEILSLQSPVDFTGFLHHDTDRWGDYRYLLFERRIGSAFVDGVHVYDGSEIVGTWYMEDHFEVDTTRSGDWAHGNGLNVTEDGVMILSFLNFSAVVAVDGNPASDTFLDVIWHGAGGPSSGLPNADYRAIEGAAQGFTRQHNATRVGDDELWVFDNSGQATSRAARLSMDHATGDLTVTGAWSFGTTCRNQGGALPVDGGVLATCANAGLVWLFDEAGTAPAWTLRAACGSQVRVTRAIPVQVR